VMHSHKHAHTPNTKTLAQNSSQNLEMFINCSIFTRLIRTINLICTIRFKYSML